MKTPGRKKKRKKKKEDEGIVLGLINRLFHFSFPISSVCYNLPAGPILLFFFLFSFKKSMHKRKFVPRLHILLYYTAYAICSTSIGSFIQLLKRLFVSRLVIPTLYTWSEMICAIESHLRNTSKLYALPISVKYSISTTAPANSYNVSSCGSYPKNASG